MNNKVIVCIFSLVVMLALILSSCSNEVVSTTTSTQAQSKTTTTSASSTTSTAATSTAAEKEWWENEWGTPKYGGSIILGLGEVMAYNWDVTSYPGADSDLYYDTLFDPEWSLDRAVYPFKGSFVPDAYWEGNLAKSWEWKDSMTLAVTINKGIKWHNKAPVNGRELTAYDIEAHYTRVMDPATSPMFVGAFGNWEKVTAVDDYTINIKFKVAAASNFQSATSRAAYNMIESPEYAALSNEERQDWHNAAGTSPWMLSEVNVGTSILFAKNPDYWGTDTRYTENQIPYADELKILIIPDISTRVAALKTGKVDVLKEITWQQTLTLSKSNPELVKGQLSAGAVGLQFRLDKEPFTDVKVRKALNMAIDRESIAESFYGGTALSFPTGMITSSYADFAYTYSEWPQSLKDEYAYNPEGAKALLTEAGFPDGFKTSVVASSTQDIQVLEIMKSFFSDIGVDMDIEVMDATTLEAFLRGGKVEQMSTRGHAHIFPPDRVIDMYYSSGSDQPISGVNDAGYDSFRDSFYAATTAEEMAKAFKAADKYVIENHWLVLSTETSVYNIWQPRLQGYSGEHLQWGMGMTFARCWIDE